MADEDPSLLDNLDDGAGDASPAAAAAPEEKPWHSDFGLDDSWADKTPADYAKHLHGEHTNLKQSFDDRLNDSLAQADEWYQNQYDLNPEFRAWKQAQAEAKAKPAEPEKPWLELPEYDRRWEQYEKEVDVYGDPDETGKRPVVGKDVKWTGDPELQSKLRAAREHRNEFSDRLLHKFPEIYKQGFDHHFPQAFKQAFQEEMKAYREEQDLISFEEQNSGILHAYDNNQLVIDPRSGKAVYSRIGQEWIKTANQLIQAGIANKKQAMEQALWIMRGKYPAAAPAQAAAPAAAQVKPAEEEVDRDADGKFRRREVASRTSRRVGARESDDDAPVDVNDKDARQKDIARRMREIRKETLANERN